MVYFCSGAVQDTNNENNKVEFFEDVKFEADLEMAG